MNPTVENAASTILASPVVTETLAKASQLPSQVPAQDPLMQGLAWVLGIVLAVLSLTKPFMGLVKQYKSDRTDSAREDADRATFERLTKQIDKLMMDMDKLMAEKDNWFRQATELKSRVEKLESYEAAHIRMKERLEEKDKTISELRASISQRDDRIMKLMEELNKTNLRLHDLEIRLTKDETTKCLTCSVNKTGVLEFPIIGFDEDNL